MLENKSALCKNIVLGMKLFFLLLLCFSVAVSWEAKDFLKHHVKMCTYNLTREHHPKKLCNQNDIQVFDHGHLHEPACVMHFREINCFLSQATIGCEKKIPLRYEYHSLSKQCFIYEYPMKGGSGSGKNNMHYANLTTALLVALLLFRVSG